MPRLPQLMPIVCLLAAGVPARAGEPAPKPIEATTAGIRAARIFAEPLVPLGTEPSAEENGALVQAIEAYRGLQRSERVEPFLAFLEAHPASAWRPALLTNLGVVYRRTGYFSKALEAWEAAWAALKEVQDPALQGLGDRAVGELVELHGRIGHMDRLKALFAEVERRPLRGAASEQVSKAKGGLWMMENQPDVSFRCGPMALASVAKAMGRSLPAGRLDKAISTQAGTSLAQNAAWSQELGLGLQMARRSPGSPMPVPALVHWKAGHFAALVEERGGHYLVKDPTFGDEIWVSRAALDAEGSGFALIPTGGLPEGWSPVSTAEGAHVWGKGNTDTGPLGGPFGGDKGTCSGMADYLYYKEYVGLGLRDTPVGYAPPRGYPVQFTVNYYNRNVAQPQTFTFSNLGQKWTSDWLVFFVDDPTSPFTPVPSRFQEAQDNGGGAPAGGPVGGGNGNGLPPGALYEVSGIGGQVPYTGFSAATNAFANQFRTHERLVRTGQASYTKYLPDGSQEVFDLSDGAITYPRRVFRTKKIDPSGNALTFGYDAQMRLKTVTDALGQVTTLAYELGSDPLKITKVTDPFGRFATLEYNASGQLKKITDAVGLTSEFTYGPTPNNPAVGADFLSALITPYGVTTFVAGESGPLKWMETTDPLGQKERVEFRHSAPGIPIYDPKPLDGFTNAWMNLRNVYFWDKRAMAQFPGDYTKAEITHLLHTAENISVVSSLHESTKKPLEGRVWLGYGQTGIYGTLLEGSGSQPLVIARALDDGSEQRTTYAYNTWGKPTSQTDALGRTRSYAYSPDGLDLLEVRNGGDLLARYTYNAQHKPLTATDAAGQTTTFTYNAFGQVTSIANPKGETTSLTYDGSGYLKQVQGAVAGATTAFTYDTVGRLASVTGPDGAATGFDYDALDRRTKVTYADGTFEETVYDRLDAGRTRDRKGQWTLMTYNALRQLTEVQDPQGRITRLDWCGCGTLEGLTDPMGRVTTWSRDLQGRVVAKLYPDLSQTSYAYDGAGRLKQRTDAKGQITTYAYLADNALKQVAYSNAQKPTPGVSYAYDPAYSRLSSMVDGTGTTTYTYQAIGATPTLGAGRLSTVTSPMANSKITYGYDELGRVVSRDINGSAETRTFDALGRLTAVTNPLGAFTYTYDGLTSRLAKVRYPNGQTTDFSYFDNAGQNRLKEIKNAKGDGTNISTFGYTYDPNGQIQSWSQAADAQTPKVYSFQYDAVGQLLGATLTDPTANQVLKTYVYGYDEAGNRLTEQINGATTSSSYNSLNQLVGQDFSATPAFRPVAPPSRPKGPGVPAKPQAPAKSGAKNGCAPKPAPAASASR